MLAGRYRYQGELGQGGSGRVLLVFDPHDGATRAIKVVPEVDAERLRWERSLLDRIAHPALARVHELLTLPAAMPPPWSLPRGAVALVEEHVAGASAAEAVAGVPEAERAGFTVALAARVARALGAVHAAGLVHGDVKPANVVVPDDPTGAKLIDLGLARPAGHVTSLSGTLGFLAPEALLGERSAATDLYALGATMHALLLGRTAFDTEASAPDLARALSRRPTVRDLPGSVPIPLRRLIGDLLADRPEARPTRAGEVALRLDAIADELGVTLPERAAVSPTPGPFERAARARSRPLVGRDAELTRLTERLTEPGVVAVVGPPEAGRTRLVLEAVRAVQAGAGIAPTYLRVEAAEPPRVEHDAIVHLEASAVDFRACADAVRAASMQGLSLRVVAEATDAPEGVAQVRIGPLPDPALRELLLELLEVDPSSALLESGRVASGGLPGRLVRLVAEALEAGLEPTRPATLADLGRREGHATIPTAAARLAELAAIAGGTIGAEAAGASLPDATAQAHRLLGAGLATLDDTGRLHLRDDLRRAVRATLTREQRRRLAAPLLERATDPLGRAHLEAELGRDVAAARGFLRAMERARADGAPERAAAIGRAALEAIDEPPFELRWMAADALRALAREPAALALLEGCEEPRALALRAELLRLVGDLDGAREVLTGARDATATAVRARLALARGERQEAAELVEGLAPTGSADEARVEEVRVFLALADGRFNDAAAAARRGLRAARRVGDVAAEARACSVEGTVLQTTGRIEEAAARFERAFELADRVGERYAAASYLVNVGLGRLERGDAGPAITALREGARRLTELGRRQLAARVLYNLGNAAALVGDDDLARSAIERARREADTDPQVRAYASVVSAELLTRAGKLEAAAKTLEAAWSEPDVPDHVRVTLGARRAIVLAVRGQADDASAALTATDALTPDRFGEVMRSIARARIELARGDLDAAARAGAEALTAAEGAGWEIRLRASLVAAEALERAGRGPEARAALANARALLDTAGASLSVDARIRLRAVSAYQRALTVAPTQASPGPAVSSRYRLLARHAKALVREPRMPRLFEAIVDAAVELADAERGFLVQRGADGELEVRAARAFGAPIDERPSRSVAARVLDSGRPLVTVDAQEDDRLDAAASVHAMALRSVLAVPVSLRRAAATAIVLDDRLRPGAFDEQVVALITDLGELAAGAIERAEALREQRREARRLAREKRRLSARVESAEQELTALRTRGADSPFARIVAQSAPMRAALHLVERVAPSDAPVLVLGESGTGKELVARALHDASARREEPYVSENCSAIPETLLESTLFGHVRGAFTGADRARRGLFEIADGGTLFLDEIGEMSASMQAKLLRVLQDGELRPIGSERTRRVDVRLVSATHRDLPQMVEDGAFRSDLFYRIAVVQVPLPPLRDRPDDVAPLVAELLERHASSRSVRVEPAALAALRAFPWPGNVRELENELRRALVLAEDTIGVAHLSPAIRGEEDAPALSELDLKGQVDALERRLIRAALEQHGGNQTRAAKTLGVSRYGLQKMMKRLGVKKP